ncbi:Uncharacterised protein [Mycobacteroides abscessus subsp. abscessus]|nr:Uncharacterised protein [Mycobacteroides abscessus subsp. abscessus]
MRSVYTPGASAPGTGNRRGVEPVASASLSYGRAEPSGSVTVRARGSSPVTVVPSSNSTW